MQICTKTGFHEYSLVFSEHLLVLQTFLAILFARVFMNSEQKGGLNAVKEDLKIQTAIHSKLSEEFTQL